MTDTPEPSATSVSLAEVQRLLVDRVVGVLALDGPVGPDARFDEDLHADSLDLVEVIEGVERALADRGVHVNLDDDALVGLRTVGQAAALIHDAARPPATP